MRFLADMGISPRVTDFLRSQGHDAVHLTEQKLHKLTDNQVMQKAKEENRILLTVDLDFTRIAASAENGNLPITIIFRLSDQRPQNIIRRTSEILITLEALANEGNAIISVSDNKIRIRKLPIKITE